jgi:glutamate racemase
LGNKYYRSAESVTCENDKKPVKSIVIACNTATAVGEEFIGSFLEKAGLDIRVIGVIGAGVCGAFQHIRENENGSIGVMATAGTVASGGYEQAIERHIKEYGYSENIAVFQQAGIGLAGAIDGSSEYLFPEGTEPYEQYRGPAFQHSAAMIDRAIMARYDFDWTENRMLYSGSRENPDTIQLNSVENYIRYHVVSLLEQVRRSPRATPLKVIILGCTHYPFYSAQIREQLQRLYHYQENGQPVYRTCMADTIVLIDPAENTALELYKYLRERQLVNDAGLDRSEFYISIPNRANPAVRLDAAGNFTYEYKYHRRVGDIQEYVRRVPFSRMTLDEQVIRRLQQKVPMVYRLICGFNRSNPKTQFLPTADRL